MKGDNSKNFEIGVLVLVHCIYPHVLSTFYCLCKHLEQIAKQAIALFQSVIVGISTN